jgi:hypothetical protein
VATYPKWIQNIINYRHDEEVISIQIDWNRFEFRNIHVVILMYLKMISKVEDISKNSRL